MKRNVAAVINPDLHGKVVRPHPIDPVVKAKQLFPGQRVKPLVKGNPHGGTRIVGTIERINDGAAIRITWSNGYTSSVVQPAFRFFDVDLDEAREFTAGSVLRRT